jgi:hypothetical protein
MDNRQLRQDILDELDFQPNVDATKIGVAVSESSKRCAIACPNKIAIFGTTVRKTHYQARKS